MSYQLRDYALLENFIKVSIITELRWHGIEVNKFGSDEKDGRVLKRALKSLYASHPDRSIQGQYLLVIMEYFNKSEIQEIQGIQEARKHVLNAAAYYVRQQINESYEGFFINGRIAKIFLSPENSTLYNSLTTSLDLRKDNLPDSNDLYDMYVALYHFMLSQVYKDADPGKDYLEPENQLFSSKKIKGFEVEKLLKDLVIKISDLQRKQIDTTKEQQSSTVFRSKKGIGVFSFFGKYSVSQFQEQSSEQIIVQVR